MRWGIFVAACCLGFLALGPVYDTNDDPAMIELLSGAAGEAHDAAFLGGPLSAALRRLYAASPAVPWYGLFIEFCNVFSAGLWAALIGAGRAPAAGRTAAAAGLLVGYGYLMLRVNFMAAAFSLSLAATAWLWKLQAERRPVLPAQAVLGVAMGLGYLIRPSLWSLLLFFCAPVLAVSAGKHNLRRLVLVGLPAGALILATAVGEHRRSTGPETQALAAFTIARSFLVDLPLSPTPAALAAAGWSRGDYEIALRFGVYDEELYSLERIRAFIAQAGREPRTAQYLRTARDFLLNRFHLLCLATLLLVLGRLWTTGGGADHAKRPQPAARALLWIWITAGIIALAANRFPPRAFVPLYLYVGALAGLAPPPLFGGAALRPVARVLRAIALPALGLLLIFTMAFWIADARAGKGRLEADFRDLAAGSRWIAPDMILVPVGRLLETHYTEVFAPVPRRLGLLMPPTGWITATPALGRFLDESGFASGRAFMGALVADRRVVFVVRRGQRDEAQWLAERLQEHYAPGERLVIEPLGMYQEGSAFYFFRIARAG